MKPTLSIVIPVFNKYAFTKACLEDLSKLPDDHEIIVVDNGSTDDTQSVVQSHARIKYINNYSNLGFAGACNIGFREATGDNVLFLNNDIRVRADHEIWTEN